MIDWQPAVKPFGLFSFVPPEEPIPPVDGRTICVGVTDANGRPVWQDEEGNFWAGPWPADARADYNTDKERSDA